MGDVEHMELVDPKGRRHLYRWVNQVPLNGARDADHVNFFEYWLKVDQKVTYHTPWRVFAKAIDRLGIAKPKMVMVYRKHLMFA